MFYIEHVYTSWRKSHSWSEHIELRSRHLPLSPPESNQSCFDSLLLVKIKIVFLFLWKRGNFYFFYQRCTWARTSRCWSLLNFKVFVLQLFTVFIIYHWTNKVFAFQLWHWDYKRGSYWYWYWYWTYMQEWFMLAYVG